jgi:hypothetical protein
VLPSVFGVSALRTVMEAAKIKTSFYINYLHTNLRNTRASIFYFILTGLLISFFMAGACVSKFG